jgi:general secretion pathway protein D
LRHPTHDARLGDNLIDKISETFNVRRAVILCAIGGVALFTAGCPKQQGNTDYHAGKKAEAVQDYDTALVDYQRALRSDPENIEFKVNVSHMRFVDGQFHADQGKKALAKGDLQAALAEFEKAEAIDPSNDSAHQMTQKTMRMLAEKSAAEAPKVPVSPEEAEVIGGPPELKPLSREPINLKMTNDAKIIYETIGKLAGLSVIFDPDFTSRRITADLPNVTLEQALDAVSLESKAFWKPVTNNIIFIAPDQPQKRKDIEDEVVRTFYLHNTLTPQDLTEIVTGLRQLLDLKRVQQVNSQNAIVVRDTPDKVLLASKIIRDIDKAKPEVLLHVQVLQTRLDRLRDLGILPGQTAAVAFTPRTALQPSSVTTSTTSTTATTTTTSTTSTTTTTSTTSTTGTSVSLNNLRNLGSADYSITLPGAQANAVLTDSSTRIIQDPEVRITDGEQAKLRIGDRVPIATGSFQAGVGVGATAGTGLINPLVNTQFQYLDVGVNIDVTPRVHPEGDVSLKLIVDVSSVTGSENIGGISQPVISQRKIEHEVRLKEGEVNILGGLIDRTESKTLNGWPGLAKIPFFRYFFSEDTKEITDDEVMIVITPHIIRLPSIEAENLRAYAAGTDTNVRVYRDDGAQTATADANSPPSPGAIAAAETTPPPPGQNRQAVQLHFNPTNVTVKPGDTTTVGLQVENAQDLFSVPLMLQYNPAVIRVEEARNGGFLSGGTQDIAIVQRVDQDHGQVIVSASRQPNTPGINGTGTLLGFVVRGVAPGDARLQVVQVNAKDSQQRPIPMISGEATIHVQ